MRVLFATAACLALAACGRADPLPPGMASRIPSADASFSIAVPAGWHDVTPSPEGLPKGQRALVVGPYLLPLNQPGPPSPGIRIAWGPGSMGIYPCCGPPSVKIAGQPVAGGSDDGRDIDGWLTHTVRGTSVPYLAVCNESVPQATCLSVLDSWRWESPSSSHVLLIVAGAGAVVLLAGGSAYWACAVVGVRCPRADRPEPGGSLGPSQWWGNRGVVYRNRSKYPRPL